VLLIDGKAGLAQFTDQAVNRPAVQELISRVDFYNNPDADAAGADKMRSYVEIRLNNGQIISGQADFARGSPQMPMSFDDAVEKFRGCAEYAGFAEAKAKAVVEQMRRLETVDNMRAAVARLFA
jgi:2-methylcitrate dehydratase PrpD